MVQHDSSDAAVEESPREAPDAADDAVEGAVKEDIRMGQIATYSINGRVADVANIRVDAYAPRDAPPILGGSDSTTERQFKKNHREIKKKHPIAKNVTGP